MLDPNFRFIKPDQHHIWPTTLIPVGSALNHLQGWFKCWSHQDQWNVLATMADIVLPAVRRRRKRRRQRLPRWFLNQTDPLETLTPEQARRKYRFWPTQIINLLQIVRNRLDPATERSFAIPAIIKLCAALRFFACGTYSISQEICTRFCCALLCCGYAIVHNEFTWSIYPYSLGLLCWHWGNR